MNATWLEALGGIVVAVIAALGGAYATRASRKTAKETTALDGYRSLYQDTRARLDILEQKSDQQDAAIDQLQQDGRQKDAQIASHERRIGMFVQYILTLRQQLIQGGLKPAVPPDALTPDLDS